MKLLKNTPILLFLSVFLLFNACRTEDEEIISTPPEQILTADSNAANLITRIATNDGSNDNILDNASCINIQLPVTILIDGIEISINSEEDFEIIEEIFNEFGDDIDELDFIFPITIILSDFTEIVINDISELEIFIEECPEENEEDEDIECIDFQYPITYSVFNQNNELIETVTIENDEAHYEFIDSLNDTDIVSINFPLTLILSNGETVTVTTIFELESAIEEAINDCDEDDDNDIDDDDCDDCDENSLLEIFDICSNGFIVDEFIQNGDNSTQQYEGFVFDFNPNGTVIVESNGVVFDGEWSASGEGNDITFEVFIDELSDFSGTWNIIEIENEDGEIGFIITNGEDYISFICNDDENEEEEEDFDCPDLEANIGDDCENATGNIGTVSEDCECIIEEEDNSELETILLDGDWIAVVDAQNGDTVNDILENFIFHFQESNSVLAISSTESINGFWDVLSNDELFILEFPNDSVLTILNNEYTVIMIDDNRIELAINNDPSQLLIFEKL